MTGRRCDTVATDARRFDSDKASVILADRTLAWRIRRRFRRLRRGAVAPGEQPQARQERAVITFPSWLRPVADFGRYG